MQQNEFYIASLRKAAEMHNAGKLPESEQTYHQLLTLYGPRPELLHGLGMLAAQRKNSGMAQFLMEQAIERGYRFFEGYFNLGTTYRVEHKRDMAEKNFAKALELADTPLKQADACVGMATLYINAGQPEKCVEWCDKALEFYPDHRFALWNRGLAYLELGRWKDGFYWYDKAGFRSDMGKDMERKLRTYGDKPEWFPSKETRKAKVVVYGEQGVGDEIMFASAIPDLIERSGSVIIDCDKRLKSLFERSFPQCKIYTTSGEDPTWVKDNPPDYRLAMGSLGRWFRKRDEDFPKRPFLKADEGRRKYWREQLSKFNGPKIGISWVGGSKYTHAHLRCVPLPLWQPIAETGANLFSLQYHDWAAEECVEVGNAWGRPIYHWQDAIDDYDETAALVSELDLVITVNTSLLHLCGALGVKTRCLTPHAAAWRYGLKGPHPFYGSVEMMRQGKDEPWEAVIDRVTARLSETKAEAA